MDDFSWVDKKEEEIKQERAEGYFDIEEGINKFVLLTHCAPLPQVWTGTKYRVAVEGDKNPSVKGLCWVLQDGKIKQAKLPYTVVKDIRALQLNPDWEFKLPFPHEFTLKAKGAGTKEVEYSLNASPKTVDIPPEILDDLRRKPTPEAIVEKIKSFESGGDQTVSPRNSAPAPTYPTPASEDINPDDIPF